MPTPSGTTPRTGRKVSRTAAWHCRRDAELHGLTLLHHDRDFGTIARVTGQPPRWYGPG